MGNCQFDIHNQDEDSVALEVRNLGCDFFSRPLKGTLHATCSFLRQPITREQVTNPGNASEAGTKF
jgi:hypothetical protein